jgi:hypothetical protein
VVAFAQGLERVAPSTEEGEGLTRLLARNFEREAWRARLLEVDLERRERGFELLVQRARLDPVARAFVEELASDPKGGELAWTARLARRALGPVSFPLRATLPGSDPLRSAARRHALLNDLLAASGGLHPPGARGPAARSAVQRSVHVTQGPDGARVAVTEVVAGVPKSRVYEGESLQAILAETPELERELGGLELRSASGAVLELRLPLPTGDPARAAEPRVAQALQPQSRSRPILTDRLGVIVHPLQSARARALGLEAGVGLEVERTYPGTYAQLLGVGAGSVLIALDGLELAAAEDIERAMAARKESDPLRLVWLDELGQRQERTWQPGAR